MKRTANWGRGRAATLLAAGLMASSLTSCLTVADDEGPILSMELFWDEEPGNRFVGGTCDTAGVDEMAWTLYEVDADGDRGEEVASYRDDTDGDSQPCYNAIDIIDPGPGEYTLVIDGFDEQGRKLWTLDGLDTLPVLRFDVSYDIEIDQD